MEGSRAQSRTRNSTVGVGCDRADDDRRRRESHVARCCYTFYDSVWKESRERAKPRPVAKLSPIAAGSLLRRAIYTRDRARALLHASDQPGKRRVKLRRLTISVQRAQMDGDTERKRLTRSLFFFFYPSSRVTRRDR